MVLDQGLTEALERLKVATCGSGGRNESNEAFERILRLRSEVLLGEDAMVVESPGIDDFDEAVAILGQAALNATLVNLYIMSVKTTVFDFVLT